MKTVWILQGNGETLGAYSSLNHLSKAVDHWMKIYPRWYLSYQTWDMNKFVEPTGWDWCYIPLNAKRSRLEAGGGTSPLKKYWGFNLIDLHLRGIDFWPKENE